MLFGIKISSQIWTAGGTRQPGFEPTTTLTAWPWIYISTPIVTPTQFQHNMIKIKRIENERIHGRSRNQPPCFTNRAMSTLVRGYQAIFAVLHRFAQSNRPPFEYERK